MHRSTQGALTFLAAVLVVLVAPVVLPPAAAASGPDHSLRTVRTSFPMTNVTYRSSVDNFPLSYEEVLPAHFRSTSTYPLLMYLHGAGSNGAVIRGGSGNGLVGYVTSATQEGQALVDLLANASTFGFIVIAPSPRSAQGFWVNSTCTGPEEQDTLDALHHEETLRHIQGVYIVGDSMGSLGALSIAGHRPGLISGIALTGVITDAFEEFAYHPVPAGSLLTPTCGKGPSATNASAQRLFEYLSVGRLDSDNFSGVKLWAAAGGMDIYAPNNATTFPFEMVNFTFLTSSCLSERAYGEPAGCTVPFANLSAANPSAYEYRVYYEPDGLHEVAELAAADMFDFFEGKVGTGCFETSFPPSTLSACP